MTLQPLGQPRQQIKCDYHELFVWHEKVLGVCDGDLSLVEGLRYEGDTALEDRLTVRQEPRLQGCGHRGQALGEGRGGGRGEGGGGGEGMGGHDGCVSVTRLSKSTV